jgi:hypothetical protein
MERNRIREDFIINLNSFIEKYRLTPKVEVVYFHLSSLSLWPLSY